MTNTEPTERLRKVAAAIAKLHIQTTSRMSREPRPKDKHKPELCMVEGPRAPGAGSTGGASSNLEAYPAVKSTEETVMTGRLFRHLPGRPGQGRLHTVTSQQLKDTTIPLQAARERA